MKHLKPIDVHVHLRDSGSFFFRQGIYDASEVGLCAILEMPNTNPNLIYEPDILRRQKQVLDQTDGHIFCAANVGMTTDMNQVNHALHLVMNRFCGMRADKTFFTDSTGNMGVKDEDIQKLIWKVKGVIGYTGVSIGHFEDEKAWKCNYDPKIPVSHSWRQNEESELIQVERQLDFASAAGFRGTFYIAHCSNPDTIQFVKDNRWRFRFEIVIEVTWHHMLLNFGDYSIHNNRVKMNPPLRRQTSQEAILEHVLKGNVDIIGTDHAPHPLEKKDDPEKPASGIPAIPFWPKGIEILRREKIKEDLLEALIFHRANSCFDLGLNPIQIEREYNPSLWDKYGYNPFSRIDK